MLCKLEAIVLHSFPYGDNSQIVKCFTDQFGLQSYLVNGVKNKKGVLKPSMIFPLTPLSIVAYHKNKGHLERIKEAQLLWSYQSITIDPVKSCIAMFISEVLSKVIHEDQPNEQEFQFVLQQLRLFDHPETQSTYFPLTFLTKLADHLGFSPAPPSTGFMYFDMLEGHFTKLSPTHPYFMDLKEASLFSDILHQKPLQSSKVVRVELLSNLLQYYKLQIDSFGEVKSLDILKELF